MNGDADEFLSLFEFKGTDSGFRYISKDVLQNVLQMSGTKTLVLKAKSGNEKGYFGTKEITVQVRGTKLQKKMFTVTYDQTGEKKVTAAEFTGQANVPYVISDLKEGTDYCVTYVKGKQQMEAKEVVDAGSCNIAEVDEVDVLERCLAENVSCRNILWSKVLGKCNCGL